ncbi:hypothetical protein M413DRAFT_437784 [Hebeloma cylindrosporum]|uniref:Uncharacterized protein n=1 Tax=Hebeloma cylindrosporum TaxID=76867 RepID=A0A0C2Z5X1_HEBCY|nr:hypothetical protein M413DRAFT_437784 [Hebeloma cylindrosporum h7]
MARSVLKDNDCYVDRAEHPQFIRLLEQAVFALRKGQGGRKTARRLANIEELRIEEIAKTISTKIVT